MKGEQHTATFSPWRIRCGDVTRLLTVTYSCAYKKTARRRPFIPLAAKKLTAMQRLRFLIGGNGLLNRLACGVSTFPGLDFYPFAFLEIFVVLEEVRNLLAQ